MARRRATGSPESGSARPQSRWRVCSLASRRRCAAACARFPRSRGAAPWTAAAQERGQPASPGGPFRTRGDDPCRSMTRNTAENPCTQHAILPPQPPHSRNASSPADPAHRPGSLRSHLGDGAFVKLTLLGMPPCPGLLLADRIGAGIRIGMGGDLGQVGVMAAALALVLAGPGHELRIGGLGGLRRRGTGSGGWMFAHDHSNNNSFSLDAAARPRLGRFTALQMRSGAAASGHGGERDLIRLRSRRVPPAVGSTTPASSRLAQG